MHKPRFAEEITVEGATEHNLKDLSVQIPRKAITVVTGVSGSGKSSLAFDTILAESHRRFFYTLSHYSRQFLDLGSRPAVRSVSGLSPAISLAQNETMPSRRATVGTLTDISELLAVLFARFGTQYCPKHKQITEPMSIDRIVENILEMGEGRLIAVCAPIVEAKKGNFAAQLTQFAERGFSRAYIDGRVTDLSPVPILQREVKHTIKVIIDVIKIKDGVKDRLERSIKAAMQEGEGVGEYFICDAQGKLDLERGGRFSGEKGCPVCGFTWPKLDSRYFSANSLGRCEECNGYGAIGIEEDDSDNETENQGNEKICDECQGTGLKNDLKAIKLGQFDIQTLLTMTLTHLSENLESIAKNAFKNNPAFTRVYFEIDQSLKRILEIRLGYLSLQRRIRTLSGGEAQRLRLAGILGENLRGIMYVLDEPSQGLHPSELDFIWYSIENLKNQGNTVIIVDHDEELMRRADWIIDLGPGGGAQGGTLLAKFKPGDALHFKNQSKTAARLADETVVDVRQLPVRTFTEFLTIYEPRLNNLKMSKVNFPHSALTVVTGVSGAGKSSLITGTLLNGFERQNVIGAGKKLLKSKVKYFDKIEGLERYEKVVLIDRKPVAKSSVSMPATYLDIMGDIRDLFSQLPESQIAGLSARSFSIYSEGGRCEECKGRGEVNLEMRFLADARVRCPVCNGRRFRPHVLDVKFAGHSLDQILELTLQEAAEIFKNFIRIKRKLEPALQLGLGYLKMGQPSASLSGGEAQRLKLVPFLSKTYGKDSLLIIDEPTTGLHFEDVVRLVNVLKKLTQQGTTLIVIEHHHSIIAAAEWLIDLGPGSAHEGGELIYEGPLPGLRKCANSLTAKYFFDLENYKIEKEGRQKAAVLPQPSI